jgi:hypothetical protein
LSVIVKVAVLGLPSVKLVDGVLNDKLIDSFPSNAVSSRIGMVKVLLVTFSEKINTPLTDV